jgi:hypothetical protein
MIAECAPFLATINVLLGKETRDHGEVSEAEVESAFRHLKWCRNCRSALTPDDRARFITSAIQERE